MRLRFILIFGNKLIHSYNHDFNYHPNLQHRTIHSTIYSDDWLVNKKNTYNNIRNGRKNWSRLCGNGNATSHGSLWGGKKTGLSPVNGLIQQPKLFNKYYISLVLRNKWTPLQIVITNGYTCSIFQVAKITRKTEITKKGRCVKKRRGAF